MGSDLRRRIEERVGKEGKTNGLTLNISTMLNKINNLEVIKGKHLVSVKSQGSCVCSKNLHNFFKCVLGSSIIFAAHNPADLKTECV